MYELEDRFDKLNCCALPTVTAAAPVIPPLVAVTVPLAAVLDAVSRPAALIVPTPPLVAQVNAGLIATPNWSFAVAVNCWVCPALKLTDDGLSVIVVSVWLTVTLTLLVAVSPGVPESVIVAVKT